MDTLNKKKLQIVSQQPGRLLAPNNINNPQTLQNQPRVSTPQKNTNTTNVNPTVVDNNTNIIVIKKTPKRIANRSQTQVDNRLNKSLISNIKGKIVDENEFKNGLCKVIIEKIPSIGYIYKVIEPQLNEDEKDIFKTLFALFKQTIEIEFDESDKNNQLDLQKTLFDLFEQLMMKYNIIISDQSQEKIFYYLERNIIGYDKIDILLKDKNVEDISCNGSNNPIFVYHRLYENIPTNIIFEEEKDLVSFIIRLAQRSRKHISLSQPMVDGRLEDGSRIQCTLQEITPRGSTFTIRRFKETPLTPIDLIKNETLSLQMASYCWLAIENGGSILFCGGTASGKTTALNALALFIPYTKKIVSIEDTREINIPHKNWIAGVTRKGFAHGQSQSSDVDMFDLIRAALRQRPQILMVGEVRGKETFIMFQAMATGHTAYSTIHAENLQMLKQRLENPPISLPRVLLTSLDIIVFFKQVRIEDKFIRKVIQIEEIVRMDTESKELMTETPFYWQANLDKFKSSGQSKLLDEIMRKMDWTTEQLEKDLRRRAEILTSFVKKEEYPLSEFTQMIESYYRDPITTYAQLVSGISPQKRREKIGE